MYNYMVRLIFSLLFFQILKISYQAVDLPWSTTYDCDDWKTTDGSNTNCDDLRKCGDWTCSGVEEMITVDANNPFGGGGKGQRHWNGDGKNVLSGGINLFTNDYEPELWIRWYMRYQKGFSWSNGGNPGYDKWLYIYGDGGTVIPEWYGGNTNVYSGTTSNFFGDGIGWKEIMNGTTGDGYFHCYLLHIKMDTDGSNGISELWIDNGKRVSGTANNHGTGTGWNQILIGSNQNNPTNGGCFYVDFDDIMVTKDSIPLNQRCPYKIRGGDDADDDDDDDDDDNIKWQVIIPLASVGFVFGICLFVCVIVLSMIIYCKIKKNSQSLSKLEMSKLNPVSKSEIEQDMVSKSEL